MEVSEKKILVAVDGDPSSLRAVRYATQKVLEMQSSGVSVSLLLLNLYSSWDWTGTAERDGRLSIDQAENYATSSGVIHLTAASDSSTSIKNDLIEWIHDADADALIIGSTSFQQASDPTSWISRSWAAIINSLMSPVPQYLYANAPCDISSLPTVLREAEPPHHRIEEEASTLKKISSRRTPQRVN